VSDYQQPLLIDRIESSGLRRIAVVGLHEAAGARTVVESLAAESVARGRTPGVTRSPREVAEGHQVPARLRLPEDVVIATRAESSPEGWSYSRTTEEGSIPLHGPDESGVMREVLDELARLCDGPALVDGCWERRGFIGPRVSQGLVLAVGAGYSRTPELSAKAARFAVEILRARASSANAALTWRDASTRDVYVLLDRDGRPYSEVPSRVKDPTARILQIDGGPPATLVLPGGLNDELLAPLVRSGLRCNLVVQDPTRINVAPVYHRAWHKGGGRIEVVESLNLIAVATNPIRDEGDDADPEAFRAQVAEQLPDLAVHDVRLEARPTEDRGWRFWRRRRSG